MTHGPIQADQREMMNKIATAIDLGFNSDVKPKKIAFVLLTAKFGDFEGGRVNYISNGERADIVTMLKELIARFEGRYVDQGGAA